MSKSPLIEAPLVIGAQLDARAAHPELADRVAIRSREQTWSYRDFRDESVRVAHCLRERLGRVDDRRPGHVAMIMENHPELLALYAGAMAVNLARGRRDLDCGCAGPGVRRPVGEGLLIRNGALIAVWVILLSFVSFRMADVLELLPW